MNPLAAYFSTDLPLRQVMLALREILLHAGLRETCKWRAPCYMLKERNVAILGRIGSQATLAFFQGALLPDAPGLLRQTGPHSRAVRQVCFTRADQVEELTGVIEDYVRAAISLAKAGQEVAISPLQEIAGLPELDQRFSEDSALRTAFSSLTPGRQRGYLAYFCGARQSATRSRRIEKYRDRILAGAGIHDCTCGLSRRMPRCDGSHRGNE